MWGGAGGEGGGEPAAGEEILDGYVKKDLFHCQNQKALPSFREGSLKWQRGEELLGRPFGKGVEIKKGASSRQKAGEAIKVHLWTVAARSAWVWTGPDQNRSQSRPLGQGQASKFCLVLVLPSNWERAPWLPNSPKLSEPHLVHSPANSLFWAPSYQPPLHPGAGGPQPSWHQLPLRFSPQTKTYLDPPAEMGNRFWAQRELALICCTVNDNNVKNENMVWGDSPQEPNILVFKGTLMSLRG